MTQAIYFQKSEAVQDEFRLIEYATLREVAVEKLQRIIRDVKEERRECDDECVKQTFGLFNRVRNVTIELIRQISIWQQTFTKPIRPRLFDCDYIVDRIIGHIDLINSTKLKRMFNFQFFRGNALLLPYPNPKTHPPVRITKEIGREINDFAAPAEDSIIFCYQFFINCLPDDVYRNKLAPLDKWMVEGWLPRVWVGEALIQSQQRASGAATTGRQTLMSSKSGISQATGSRQSHSGGNKSHRSTLRSRASSKQHRHTTDGGRDDGDSDCGGGGGNGGHSDDVLRAKSPTTMCRQRAGAAAAAAAAALVAAKGSNGLGKVQSGAKHTSAIKRRNMLNSREASTSRLLSGDEQDDGVSPSSSRRRSGRRSPKRSRAALCRSRTPTADSRSISSKQSKGSSRSGGNGNGDDDDDDDADAAGDITLATAEREAAARAAEIRKLEQYYASIEGMFTPQVGRNVVRPTSATGQLRAAKELHDELQALNQTHAEQVNYSHTSKTEAAMREATLNTALQNGAGGSQRVAMVDAVMSGNRKTKNKPHHHSRVVSPRHMSNKTRDADVKVNSANYSTAEDNGNGSMHSADASSVGSRRSQTSDIEEDDEEDEHEADEAAGVGRGRGRGHQRSGPHGSSGRRVSIISELTPTTPTHSRKNTITSIPDGLEDYIIDQTGQRQSQRAPGSAGATRGVRDRRNSRRMSDLTVTFSESEGLPPNPADLISTPTGAGVGAIVTRSVDIKRGTKGQLSKSVPISSAVALQSSPHRARPKHDVQTGRISGVKSPLKTSKRIQQQQQQQQLLHRRKQPHEQQFGERVFVSGPDLTSTKQATEKPILQPLQIPPYVAQKSHQKDKGDIITAAASAATLNRTAGGRAQSPTSKGRDGSGSGNKFFDIDSAVADSRNCYSNSNTSRSSTPTSSRSTARRQQREASAAVIDDAPYRRRRGPPPLPSATVKLSTSGMRALLSQDPNFDLKSY